MDPAISPRGGSNPGWLPRIRSRPGRVHLIGIGGAGMRALANLFLEADWRVSGSDLDASAASTLTDLGATLHAGHSAEHVPADADLVIYSDAIGPQNSERKRAAQRGTPLVSYPQMIGLLMEGSRGLAVAGTHGKSTTVAMAAEIFAAAEIDSCVVFGATRLDGKPGGQLGTKPLVLAEACEYRANFLNLRPQSAAILNIELDHCDYYRSKQQLIETFAQFSQQVAADGVLLVHSGCAAAMEATNHAPARRTFGFWPQSDWSARRLRGSRGMFTFDLCYRARLLTTVKLAVPGRHNVLNALAAAALAVETGVDNQHVGAGLQAFRGLKRRLELIGTCGGVAILDDYAHHPTEIAASLGAVRAMFPRRRVLCVFQPHQASRTERLLDEFASALQNADKVAVAEIFRAREPAVSPGGVSAAALAARVRELGADTCREHQVSDIEQRLLKETRPGDVLVIMGAGDIGKLGDGIARRLRKNRAAG